MKKVQPPKIKKLKKDDKIVGVGIFNRKGIINHAPMS